MPVYLTAHPPATRQFRVARRKPGWHHRPTVTAIVVHTAENIHDTIGVDTGAEAVARFIARRDTPGSYHSIVDSDSVCRVGEYEWEMFHEGTGGNRWSLGLSFACRADLWPEHLVDSSWHTRAIVNGAVEAVAMAQWVHTTYGVAIPARRLTAAEYRSGTPGFVGHGDLDPGRRSDPGGRFPWGQFLQAVHDRSGAEDPVPGGPRVTGPGADWRVAELQAELRARGFDPGPVDGLYGPRTHAAVLAALGSV